MMSIKQFCDRHDACSKGRKWALENCTTMAEVWVKAKPEWLIWVGTRPGVLPDRELRLFAVRCARRVQHLMKDPRSLAALDVAERHANGEATDAELAAAGAVSRAAAWEAASAADAAAWAVSSAAAMFAAWTAARTAAWEAASAAAAAAAWEASLAVSSAAAMSEVTDTQASDMRSLTPSFEK